MFVMVLPVASVLELAQVFVKVSLLPELVFIPLGISDPNISKRIDLEIWTDRKPFDSCVWI